MTTEAQAIADLATKHREPIIVKNSDGREFLVLPDDMTRHDVSECNAIKRHLPDFIAQALILQTVESLVDYVNRFKTPNSVLFADIDTNSILTAIDYHGPGQPAHVAHLARLTLPHSVEFKTWRDASGKLIGQLEFARFLEENAADVAAPSGAELLEACRDLHAIRKVNFKKAVRTATDHENFEFTDETEARTSGGVEVPTKFRLQIPIYFGDTTTELYAFLRWKLDDGALHLGIVLHRAEHVRQAVFKQIVLDAAERTGLPAVFGKLNL